MIYHECNIYICFAIIQHCSLNLYMWKMKWWGNGYSVKELEPTHLRGISLFWSLSQTERLITVSTMQYWLFSNPGGLYPKLSLPILTTCGWLIRWYVILFLFLPKQNFFSVTWVRYIMPTVWRQHWIPQHLGKTVHTRKKAQISISHVWYPPILSKEHCFYWAQIC